MLQISYKVELNSNFQIFVTKMKEMAQTVSSLHSKLQHCAKTSFHDIKDAYKNAIHNIPECIVGKVKSSIQKIKNVFGKVLNLDN